MPPLRVLTLDLRAPLRYALCNLAPFAPSGEGESAALFELDRDTASSLDPVVGTYLPQPSCTGTASSEGEMIIAAGIYLFAQLPGPGIGGDLKEWLTAAAVELQKEGLWQGKKMKDRLYLRILSEEAGPVYQLIRPIA